MCKYTCPNSKPIFTLFGSLYRVCRPFYYTARGHVLTCSTCNLTYIKMARFTPLLLSNWNKNSMWAMWANPNPFLKFKSVLVFWVTVEACAVCSVCCPLICQHWWICKIMGKKIATLSLWSLPVFQQRSSSRGSCQVSYKLVKYHSQEHACNFQTDVSDFMLIVPPLA